MSLRYGTVLFCALISFSTASAQPVRVDQNAEENSATISVDAPGGIVEWRNVARGVASVANFDEDAVATLFPPGTLNLNSIASQLVVSGLSLGLGRGVSLAIEFDRGAPTGLRVAFDRDELRQTLNLLKGIVRQVVFRWGDGQDGRYGLFLDEDWQRRSASRPVVVIVHGYNSEPAEFDALRGLLRESGFGCAVFAYPNDAPVSFSGGQLAMALREFEQVYPDRRIALVAHSMGGLLSRFVIEDPDSPELANIERLIMVATPNQGSNLARIPVSLDVWSNWLDGEPDTVKTVFFESVLDGLNEARFDLQPESRLLERLNGLPRNPNVRYSLLLGNQGPATREQLDELRRWIIAGQSANPVLRALGPRLDELLVDLDELVDGVGDGAVAVERGRLVGVDDTVVLPFRHATISSALTGQAGRNLVTEIVARLERR